MARAREFGRNQRLAGQLQRELAVLMQREAGQYMDINRAGMITISAVDVSPDLQHAKVYFTTLAARPADVDVDTGSGPDSHAELNDQLNTMAGLFRRWLARRLPLKRVPELCFAFDESIARANRLDALIDAVRRE